MKEEAVNDALLRQVLLGKVDDEVRAQIESLFLTDVAMRERVLNAEQDLIEDYLEDSLDADDKERFVLRYAQTPAQQRQLRITKSIKDWAVAESAGSHMLVDAGETSGQGHSVDASRRADASESSSRGDSSDRTESLGSWWGRLLRPAFVLPAIAVIVLAILLVIFGVNPWREQRRHLAIEQELAQLNSPSGSREVPPGLEVVTLTPLTLRGPDSPAELKLRAGVPYVPLRLRSLRQEQYSSYEAVVRRIRDGQTYTIRDLRSDNSGEIPLKLLPEILTRGTYQVRITGLNADGSAGAVEEYQFTVGG